MRKCLSAPSLSSLANDNTVLAPPMRSRNPTSNSGTLHKRNVSVGAVMGEVFHMPTNPLEAVGFESVLHVSQKTVAECSLQYATFPEGLLHKDRDRDRDDVAYDMATCLATPPDVPEEVTRMRFDKRICWTQQDGRNQRYMEILARLRRRRSSLSLSSVDGGGSGGGTGSV